MLTREGGREVKKETYLFFGKSTPLDNVRTMKVGPPSACDTSFLPRDAEGRDLTHTPCPPPQVVDAFIEPREMEEGRWPEEFDLSDHGFLTAQYLLKG